ncbi:uncharacterized membrane protein YcgQ (UPF0703/DUF1980 family) [Paenibacillus phyllosphaerae]|uniref:Uncharacterized membrane protein YcgQ (UPF0703/DUF1980 family) n=1 Tax=Paenibacillus phyllosphaerae TaxID=274593 RepID=A0A7W5AVE8_9BACL|nr:hypothetical protein [Paenibacillus phyllosphaerae]MBB3109515.1 uncharacterized membrane protein YcgQ (UPF0703/DUF1980 family) [Paenibacillus phyllosphaerae]
MLEKLRGNQETRYSALSFVSLLSVLLLHIIHWVSAPLLMGAAASMQMSHHEMGGSGGIIMGLLMLILFIINLVSMYFAFRQLSIAWRKHRQGEHHSYWCSCISLVVLGMGLYTMVTL